MNRRPSRSSIVLAIIYKDLRAFCRDRLWLALTPFSMVMFIGMFWLLPADVDETIRVGLFPPDMAEPLAALEGDGESREHGVEIVTFDREQALMAAVSGESEDEKSEDIHIGIAYSEDFMSAIAAGERGAATVYVDAGVPEEIRRFIASEIREVAFAFQSMAGGEDAASALPVVFPEDEEFVLGEDRAGIQVPLREKLRPMIALLILMIGQVALAGLVAVEIEHRTITALLVSPARVWDVLSAKIITGTVIGFAQALIVLLGTWGFGEHWLLVVLLMLLGALMMSALGMMAGSAGRDFMSTMFISLVLLIPIMVPTFAVLFPGSMPLWVRALPSFGITEALVGVVGYGRGTAYAAPYIGLSAAWVVVLSAAALLILRRRLASL